jgi:hypothetical protein
MTHSLISFFSEDRDSPQLAKELNVSHLDPEQGAQLTALIKKYWCVFDNRGTFVPVKQYQCFIDTGTATSIAIKNIRYKPREIPIMEQSIAALKKMGQICQINNRQWLFKALLAPKPHQEHVRNIDEFLWRFCVNYVRLNQVTRLIANPISLCDNAVDFAFQGFWMWLYNAIMVYHQISVAPE